MPLKCGEQKNREIRIVLSMTRQETIHRLRQYLDWLGGFTTADIVGGSKKVQKCADVIYG